MEQNKFSFKKNEIVTDVRNLTKRDCLACLAQLWDPLGLVTTATIKLGSDLQELWSVGYVWDETLPGEFQLKWMKNIQTLNQLLTPEFNRKPEPDTAVGFPEVHGFCDGGEKAYGSVIFLRWKLEHGSYSCIPLMIKAFVALLKKKLIPRLELMGCFSLARLYSKGKEALAFAEITSCKSVFWMDSQTVLSEFRDTGKYIRSDSNPADVLTRGAPPEKLKSWMEGPRFLWRPEEEWPKFEDDGESKKELKPNKVKATKPNEPTNCGCIRRISRHQTSIRQPYFGTLNDILFNLRQSKKNLGLCLEIY